MRLIFSRKGFDSSAGGCASPLLDGKPVSLPIPANGPSVLRYRDLDAPIAHLVRDLSAGKVKPAHYCHLDPELEPLPERGDRTAVDVGRHSDRSVPAKSEEARLRAPWRTPWRGTLGQLGAAQGHLRNERIARDDLFLFWGLFRPVQRKARKWRFCGAAEHRIFGWLQIDEVIPLATAKDIDQALRRHSWLAHHPHLRGGWPQSNTLYLGREKLAVAGIDGPGSGLFKVGHRLTAPSADGPSQWHMPDWLNPCHGGPGMTYHSEARWAADGALRAASRGQEFVVRESLSSDGLHWLAHLFAEQGVCAQLSPEQSP